MLELAQLIKEKTCVLFAGAGISRDAGLPGWQELAFQLYDRLNKRSLISNPYKGIVGTLVSAPDTFQVGIDTLINIVRRSEVLAELREILKPARESQTHNVLASLKFKGFITTNYDRLLNKCVSDHAWKLSNSLSELKLVSSAINSPDSQFLLKLHGDLDNALPPEDIKVVQGGAILVLSKSDYLLLKGNRLEPLRLAMHAVLQQHSVVFLGYSFGDPYIREILEFLCEHCQFIKPSFYICRKSDQIPILPSNVIPIQPVDEWGQLSDWLMELKGLTTRGSDSITRLPKVSKISEDVRSSLETLSEYIHGLEFDDIPSKTITSILVPELAQRSVIDFKWVCQNVQKLLNVGPLWAETFAERTIHQLKALKLIRERTEGTSYEVIASRINQLQKRAGAEWEEDRTSFYTSVKRRLSRAGPLNDSFLTKVDAILHHLCLGFGKRLAEWINGGSGRELGLSHIHELVSIYMDDSEDQRKGEELLGFIFEKPEDEEVGYIYRLLSSSFLLNSVKLDPTAAKFLKDYISDYELYLDSNVLLPAIIKEHKNHSWMVNLLRESKQAGCSLFVIEDILNEVFAHKAVTDTISQTCGSTQKGFSAYLSMHGDRANCFIQGFLALPKSHSSSFREYVNSYNTRKIYAVLKELEIGVITSAETQIDRKAYVGLSNAIGEEWARRTGDLTGDKKISRPDVLNQNEAKQFLFLYHRRKDRLSHGSSDKVWFLSFETILERVFLRNPTSWGKPPTFPVSAWASFLDSRLLSSPKNRKDILNAIIRGNSTSYSLPDPVSLVHKSVFGSRVISRDEASAIQTALSDGKFFAQFEGVRSHLRKKTPKDGLDVGELMDGLSGVAKEVQEELSEQLASERHSHSRQQKEKDQRIEHLEREIAVLKTTKKKSKRRRS